MAPFATLSKRPPFLFCTESTSDVTSPHWHVPCAPEPWCLWGAHFLFEFIPRVLSHYLASETPGLFGEARPVTLPLLWSDWFHHTIPLFTATPLPQLDEITFSCISRVLSERHWITSYSALAWLPCFLLPIGLLCSSWMARTRSLCHFSCQVWNLNTGHSQTLLH